MSKYSASCGFSSTLSTSPFSMFQPIHPFMPQLPLPCHAAPRASADLQPRRSQRSAAAAALQAIHSQIAPATRRSMSVPPDAAAAAAKGSGATAEPEEGGGEDVKPALNDEGQAVNDEERSERLVAGGLATPGWHCRTSEDWKRIPCTPSFTAASSLCLHAGCSCTEVVLFCT